MHLCMFMLLHACEFWGGVGAGYIGGVQSFLLRALSSSEIWERDLLRGSRTPSSPFFLFLPEITKDVRKSEF